MKRLVSIASLALVLGATALSPTSASARTVEPGSIWLAVGSGFGFKTATNIGGSSGFWMVNVQGEYCFSTTLSLVSDVDIGLANTNPIRLRIGTKHRMTGLDLPLSPYLQVQASVGRLFNALGANLTLLGVRAGLGVDYFLTRRISASVGFSTDLGTTLGERPALYGTHELLVSLGYAW